MRSSQNALTAQPSISLARSVLHFAAFTTHEFVAASLGFM